MVQFITGKETQVKTVVVHPLCPTKKLKVWQKIKTFFSKKARAKGGN